MADRSSSHSSNPPKDHQIAASERELRLRTIKGLRQLLRDGTTMSPMPDGMGVESNGYGLWLVAYDPQPISTAPISDEEILRRIEAREALADAKKQR